MSSIFRASNSVFLVALFAAGIAVGSAFLPAPAKAAEIQNVAYDSAPPMDGDFTDGPDSTELVPFEQVRAMLDCDIFLGCNGHGDLHAANSSVLTNVCTYEDDECSLPLAWYQVEDYIDQYQDAGVASIRQPLPPNKVRVAAK